METIQNSRIFEARQFFSAFNNPRSRDFVRRMMISNYWEGILDHHPDKGILDHQDVLNKCTKLVDQVFHETVQIIDEPESLFPLFHRLSRKNPRQHSVWFPEFDQAYENYKHFKKLFIRYDQLKPFLQGESFCDIGCGGGDLVYFLKTNYAKFWQYAGIDVLDWRTKKIKDEINFEMLDFSKPDTRSKNKYDTLTCIAVLHHVGNTDESRSIFLTNIHNAMSEDGVLIIEEDVILPGQEIESDTDYIKQTATASADSLLFKEFLALNREDQTDAIIIIDFLANCLSGGVPDMAFPCGFKSIKEWEELFAENGFAIEDVRIQGFRKGIFNRSSHVFFILRHKKGH